MSDAPIAHYGEDGKVIFRASAASKCTKALVASLLGFTPVPPGADMQRRFDLGHQHEPFLLTQAEAAGWSLYGAQDEFEVAIGDNIVIRCHIDSLGTHPTYGKGNIECKTMSPKQYEKWLKNKWRDFPYYATQAAVYWAATQPDVLCMVVGCKNDEPMIGEHGEVWEKGEKIIAVDVSYHFETPTNLAKVKAHLAKAANIAKAGAGELPDACDAKDYPCPFVYLHEDKNEMTGFDNVWANEEEMDEFAAVAESYALAAADEAKAKTEKAGLRSRLIELLKDDRLKIAGRYEVRMNTQVRTSLDKKALVDAGVDVAAYTVSSEVETLTVKELI